MNKRQVGSSYEDMAAAYLISQGYVILERNYRTRQGEIDIIAREGPCLAFVEVKYRRDQAKGDPAEAVNGPKQKRIRWVAKSYLHSKGLGEGGPCRFDVVSILGQEPRLIRDAF